MNQTVEQSRTDVKVDDTVLFRGIYFEWFEFHYVGFIVDFHSLNLGFI